MVERRSLPVPATGPVPVPFVIAGSGELLARDTVWEEHSHPVHELLWNERGASSAVVGTRMWTITPTVGLWMPAGTLHSGSAPAGTSYRAALVAPHAVPSMAEVPVIVEMTPLLRLLLERLGDPELSDRSRAVTEALVLDVLAPSHRDLSVHLPAAPLLRPIAEAVCDHPADERGLAEWAAELGVSSRTISRAFRTETGIGFTRWVAVVRAHHAVALLARGTTVEDVAELVGYRSASAFCAAFRRTTGRTPGTFRPG